MSICASRKKPVIDSPCPFLTYLIMLNTHDDENGDSTRTVKRIVRGEIVHVEEVDWTLCLPYVRKKVSEIMVTNTTRGSRRSTRASRRINYNENLN